MHGGFAKHHKKYERRVVLQENTVKDDNGHRAQSRAQRRLCFTSSLYTASTVSHTISRHKLRHKRRSFSVPTSAHARGSKISEMTGGRSPQVRIRLPPPSRRPKALGRVSKNQWLTQSEVQPNKVDASISSWTKPVLSIMEETRLVHDPPS